MTSHRGVRAAAAVLAVSLAALALASVLGGRHEGGSGATALERLVTSSPPSPAPATPSVTPGDAGAIDAPQGLAPPVELRVPSVDIRMKVEPTGVTPDGQMALPERPTVAGWYKFGPEPLEPGSTVLAGHVDSRRFGVGPLARLSELTPGDLMSVRLQGGREVRYRVAAVQRFDKQSRALEAVFDRDGPSILRVVTCGGAYDPDSGGYKDNVVLTARPFATR